MRLVAGARSVAAHLVRPLARGAARAYVAGDTLDDAADVAERHSARGLGVTIGYWDAPDDSPRQVADEYLSTIEVVSASAHGYLSIKLPALDYSQDLLAQVVERAARRRVRVHVDALGPETAERVRSVCDAMLDGGASLSYTLPGRWSRSVQDAEWVIARGLVVRVVKGQWADPTQPDLNPTAGFLKVVETLAGRACHVAVATHDLKLAGRAVKLLRDAGTSCELELLHGLPMRRSLQLADWLALGVHVYVPYGKAYLPYALSKAQAHPRIVWWLVRDMVSSWRPYQKIDRRIRDLMSPKREAVAAPATRVR